MPCQPNILVLHSDEHSYRFLSSRSPEKGGEPCQTPTLDRLVAQGVNFDKAYCQFPLCTPSRIAMLTGRHAHRCGAWGNGSILSPDLPTWGSHFQANGYHTATIGKMHLGGSLQYAGFGARPYGDFGGMCSHQYDPLSRHNDQNEAGMNRQAFVRIQVVATGELSHLTRELVAGSVIKVSGFINRHESRNGNPLLVLHAQQIQMIN